MEAKRALDEALKMLGMISLKGDAVDVMAAAKGNIRAVIAQLEAAEKAKVNDNG